MKSLVSDSGRTPIPIKSETGKTVEKYRSCGAASEGRANTPCAADGSSPSPPKIGGLVLEIIASQYHLRIKIGPTRISSLFRHEMGLIRVQKGSSSRRSMHFIAALRVWVTQLCDQLSGDDIKLVDT